MAQPFKIEIAGLSGLQNHLNESLFKVERELDREVRSSMETITRNAIRDAPVDEGELRRSISYHRLGSMDYEIAIQVDYAAFIEFGTKTKVKIPADLQDIASQYRGSRGGSFKDLLTAIVRWVHRKGIAGTKSAKTGRRKGSRISQFAEDYQVAYAIALSIAKKGVEPHPFFFHNFRNEEPKLIARLEKVLGDVFP